MIGEKNEKEKKETINMGRNRRSNKEDKKGEKQ